MYGIGSVPIATGWKCTNCHRTHRSSIPQSASGNTRSRPELTTGTSRPPRNWSAPCPESLERCKTILSRSDPICFLFADSYVPLIMRGCIPDIKSSKEFAHEKNTKAPEGTATGVTTGGVIGGTLGLLAGIGALAIPGLGPFIAAGPIMAALAGLGVGGAVGGLVGALVGMGIPEYEAKRYEGRVKNGGVLLSVHCDTLR